MWVPKHFQVTDQELITEFIKSVGLATLISQDTNYPFATHTPIEIENDEKGQQVLRGHIAKVNPQSKLLKENPKALVIFHSPTQHYISSSWYQDPNAPTWNYMSVHIYGSVRILNKEEVYQSIKRLTDRHERNNPNPVSLDTLPDNIKAMLNGVTGFEVSMDKIEAQFKLSQNRHQADLRNITNELESINTPLSKLMAKELRNRLTA